MQIKENKKAKVLTQEWVCQGPFEMVKFTKVMVDEQGKPTQHIPWGGEGTTGTLIYTREGVMSVAFNGGDAIREGERLPPEKFYAQTLAYAGSYHFSSDESGVCTRIQTANATGEGKLGQELVRYLELLPNGQLRSTSPIIQKIPGGPRWRMVVDWKLPETFTPIQDTSLPSTAEDMDLLNLMVDAQERKTSVPHIDTFQGVFELKDFNVLSTDGCAQAWKGGAKGSLIFSGDHLSLSVNTQEMLNRVKAGNSVENVLGHCFFYTGSFTFHDFHLVLKVEQTSDPKKIGKEFSFTIEQSQSGGLFLSFPLAGVKGDRAEMRFERLTLEKQQKLDSELQIYPWPQDGKRPLLVGIVHSSVKGDPAVSCDGQKVSSIPPFSSHGLK